MAEDFDKLDNPEWDDTNTRSADSAAKLQATRAVLLMNQKDFADLLGIPVSTLQNWEQRRTEPDAIARTLIDLIFEDPLEMSRRMASRHAA